jgi:branched-chain amino acid transport system permease protein
MSVGAFAGAIACIALESVIPITFLRLAAGMVVGAFFGALTGVLVGIPVLRLKGDYLAIVTLAFGEIIKNIINCIYVGLDQGRLRFGFLLTNANQLYMSEHGRVLVEGPMGLTRVPRISTFTMGFVLVMVTLFIVLNLVNSRTGRAIMALRDNRIAAESLGISVTKYKLIAFVTSAALAGAAGTLFSMNFSTTVASRFGINMSILILVFVVLGGLRSIRGSIIVAALLTVLPEMLRQFNDYRMLIYAIVLILVMIATNNPTIHSFIKRIKDAVISMFRRKKSLEGGGVSG